MGYGPGSRVCCEWPVKHPRPRVSHNQRGRLFIPYPLFDQLCPHADPPKPPRSVRLYIFDNGVIKGVDPAITQRAQYIVLKNSETKLLNSQDYDVFARHVRSRGRVPRN
jgi:hypothetical protein